MQVGARTPRSSATRIFIAPSHLCFAAVRSSAPPPSLRAPPGARTSLLDHLGETPPEPAPDAPDPAGPSPHRGTLRARRVDLVEHPAVGEVGRLRLLPSAKHAVDGDELELRELRGVFRRDLRVARPVEVLRRELLPLRPVEELEVRLRDRLRAVRRSSRPPRPAARPGWTSEGRRSRTVPCRAARPRGTPRSPRRGGRRRGRARRTSWSSRGRRSRAPARS